jgi:hypothetical protein
VCPRRGVGGWTIPASPETGVALDGGSVVASESSEVVTLQTLLDIRSNPTVQVERDGRSAHYTAVPDTASRDRLNPSRSAPGPRPGIGVLSKSFGDPEARASERPSSLQCTPDPLSGMVGAGTVREENSMSIRRTHSLVTLAAVAALALGSSAARAADPAPAPTTAWDQAAVTSLAGQLAKASVELYDEYYKTPGSSGGQIGTGQAEDAYKLKHKLRRLEEQSQDLAGALAAGKGRAETLPAVEDLGELARDVRVLLSHMYVQSPLQARIDTAHDLWLKLMPFYGINPPPAKR